jgi:hypothetical protein
MLILQIALGIVLAYVIINFTGRVMVAGIALLLVLLVFAIYAFVHQQLRARSDDAERAKRDAISEANLFFDCDTRGKGAPSISPNPYESATDRAFHGSDQDRKY